MDLKEQYTSQFFIIIIIIFLKKQEPGKGWADETWN